MSTFCRVPNVILLTRKVIITQDYKTASGIVARFFTQQIMNAWGNNGGSQAGHSGSPLGGYNRFRGRGSVFLMASYSSLHMLFHVPSSSVAVSGPDYQLLNLSFFFATNVSVAFSC